MKSYAIGVLRSVVMNQDIVDYLNRIDETLRPFEGSFVIHGGTKYVKEGEPDFDLIVISFPNRKNAEGWYNSPEYQGILSLRTRNSVGEVFLIDGVGPNHKATDILET